MCSSVTSNNLPLKFFLLFSIGSTNTTLILSPITFLKCSTFLNGLFSPGDETSKLYEFLYSLQHQAKDQLIHLL